MKAYSTFDLWENEKIIMIKRRHWFVYFLETIPFILMTLMPFAFLVVVSIFVPDASVYLENYSGFIVFYSASWLMMTWLMFSINWTNYYLDLLILTDRRIIDIEQVGLFSRVFTETKLENIQDIEVVVSGMFPSLMGFGDLDIQTAGTKDVLIFRDMPDIYKLKETISNLSHHLLEKTDKKYSTGRARI